MNFSIRQRLVGIIGIVAFGLIMLVAISIWTTRSLIIDQTRTGLSNYVESAYSIMARNAERVGAGEFSEDEAKQRSNSAIGAMRYAGSGYFWIHDLNQKMIMHPIKPTLNGKDLTALEDKAGNALFSGMNKVIKEHAGSGFYRYYWGKPGADKEAVFAKESYVKLFKPWGYVIGTGVYIDDLNARVWNAVRMLVLTAAGLLIVLGAVVFYIARSIDRPLSRIRQSMASLAEGRTDIDTDDSSMPSDLKRMAAAVVVFRDNAVDREALSRKQDEEQRVRFERQNRVDTLIGGFQETSESALTSVGEFMTQMQSAAQSLAEIADSTSGQATGAASASEVASTNVQTVASASEELAASIAEISEQVVRTNEIVDHATSSTQAASERVSALADAAQKIGDVVNLIQDIAEQTNLLALNATIEAARAGEMGKGFAVVASEVKTLANQTGKATEEIAAQITFVQDSTREAVDAIQGIAKTMVDVNGYTSSIAAAVEEQGAATNEISRNAAEAAEGTQRVAENIAGVLSAVADTNQSAEQVEDFAREATGQADTLRMSVGKFLKSVAAA